MSKTMYGEPWDELTEIVLQGVEKPNLRSMLEYLVRNGRVQEACDIKEMYKLGPVKQ